MPTKTHQLFNLLHPCLNTSWLNILIVWIGRIQLPMFVHQIAKLTCFFYAWSWLGSNLFRFSCQAPRIYTSGGKLSGHGFRQSLQYFWKVRGRDGLLKPIGILLYAMKSGNLYTFASQSCSDVTAKKSAMLHLLRVPGTLHGRAFKAEAWDSHAFRNVSLPFFYLPVGLLVVRRPCIFPAHSERVCEQLWIFMHGCGRPCLPLKLFGFCPGTSSTPRRSELVPFFLG